MPKKFNTLAMYQALAGGMVAHYSSLEFRTHSPGIGTKKGNKWLYSSVETMTQKKKGPEKEIGIKMSVGNLIQVK